MTTTAPVPSRLDDLDDPFWRACARSQLLLHQCQVCSRMYWPASCCVDHGGSAMAWVPSPGRGALETYTVVHRTGLPGFASRTPYTVAVVRLEEGVLFHTSVVGADPADLRIGMPLTVEFAVQADGVYLPVFRPAAPAVDAPDPTPPTED